MALTSAESAARRQHMMENQLRPFDVTDLNVLAAFDSAPRESFVASWAESSAYLDKEVASSGASGRMLLAPATLARLVQAAAVQPGDKALDVAGGSGYSAAILGALGARVASLDADPKALEAGPFAVILINGAFEKLPDDLVRVLAEGGRLVGVDASAGAPKAVLIERAGGSISRRVLFDAHAPRLKEYSRAPEFTF